MKIFEDDIIIAGRYMVVNIALPKIDSETGLERPESHRDPRQFRIKPPLYYGTVEKVGPRCNTKVGDTVWVERWAYIQINIDNKRILVSDKDVVIRNGRALPGVSILGLIQDQKPKSDALDLGKVEEEEKEYYFGQILDSGGRFKKSDFVWINKLERDQWKIKFDVLVFREVDDFMMLHAKPDQDEILEEVHERNGTK